MLFGAERGLSVVPEKRVGHANKLSLPTQRFFLAMAQTGFSLALLTVSASASPASAVDIPEVSEPACYALMTDAECKAYRATLASAASPGARNAIKARYDQLQHEREQTCPCSVRHEWIRLKQSPSRISGLTS